MDSVVPKVAIAETAMEVCSGGGSSVGAGACAGAGAGAGAGGSGLAPGSCAPQIPGPACDPFLEVLTQAGVHVEITPSMHRSVVTVTDEIARELAKMEDGKDGGGVAPTRVCLETWFINHVNRQACVANLAYLKAFQGQPGVPKLYWYVVIVWVRAWVWTCLRTQARARA